MIYVCEMSSSGSGYGSVTGFSEHDNGLCVPKKAGNFSKSWENISFSRKALLQTLRQSVR
jgi:hypothetical protein